MKGKFFFILGYFSVFSVQDSKAQAYNVNDYLKMPSVVPSSPNVASIERFGNVPVDYSTGVPGITIPVWNIKCGSIEWPVSFSYHAGGIKVDEIASSVGLGWALIGQGVISRSVINKPDEQYTTHPNYASVTANDYNYLYSVRDGKDDSEMDIFSYNFNGRSGKFLIKQDGSIFTMPYVNLKITNNSFNSFVIIDELGASYTFDQKETVNSDANGAFSTYTCSWYLSKVQTADKRQSIDFVYITEGTSYQSFYNYSQSIGVRPVMPAAGCGAPEYSESFSQPFFAKTSNTTYTLQLSQINFPNGYITFNYAADRPDILGTAKGRLTNVSIYQQSSSQLVKKFICNQSYFFYNPQGAASDPKQYRLRLDRLDEISGDLISTKPYYFEYNTTSMVPRENFGQDKWGFNNGHYENLSLIQSVNVNFINGNYIIGSADRTTDIVKMQACMLNAITWPSGGKTVFTFEPHQYNTNHTLTTTASVQAYIDGSSLQTQTNSVTFTYPSSGALNSRIKVNLSKYNFPGVSNQPYVKLTDLTTSTIVNNVSGFDPNNQFQSDNSFLLSPGHNYKAEAYVYTSVSNIQLTAQIIVQWDVNTGTIVIENGGGLRIKEIKNYTSGTYLAGDEVYEYVLGTPLTPFSYVDKTYNDVIYRIGIGSCTVGGGTCSYTQSGPCRVYHSGSLYPSSTVSGSPLLYSSVTKYNKDGSGADNGKTEYNYDIIEDQEIPVGGPSLFNAHLITNDWKNGFLKSELNYKKFGAIYQLISKTEKEYLECKHGTAYSLKVYPIYMHSGCENQGSGYINNDVNFFAFPIYTGSKKLNKTIATTLDDNGNQIVTISTSEYTNTNNDFVTKTSAIDSKKDEKSITFKYPIDFSAAGNVYEKMVQQNIVAPIIEQKSFTGSTPLLLSTIKNNYRDWKNDSRVIALEIVQTSLFNNTLENRLQYSNYDLFKNILSVSKVNDAVESYIYDYQNSYPIAEVKNASSSDVAYTSFEADGTGNWNGYTGTITSVTISPFPITGTKYYNITSTATLSKPVVSGKVYIISYWSKNLASPYAINGGTGPFKSGRTLNSQWRYYEHEITASSTTLTITGTGAIDEVRLYPKGAQMTTSTYEPLIGIKSQCDVNNRITYYEYDAFQRLKLIRDQDNNIIKRFDYQYKQLP